MGTTNVAPWWQTQPPLRGEWTCLLCELLETCDGGGEIWGERFRMGEGDMRGGGSQDGEGGQDVADDLQGTYVWGLQQVQAALLFGT